MPARFILHIIITLVLFAIGWWIYMHMNDDGYDINSVTLATYWFATLVFILFSWLFYWFVHRLKTRAWVIALILAVVISLAATIALLYYSREHQQQLEEEAMLEEQQKSSETNKQTEQTQESASSNEIEILNLGEE